MKKEKKKKNSLKLEVDSSGKVAISHGERERERNNSPKVNRLNHKVENYNLNTNQEENPLLFSQV